MCWIFESRHILANSILPTPMFHVRTFVWRANVSIKSSGQDSLQLNWNEFIILFQFLLHDFAISVEIFKGHPLWVILEMKYYNLDVLGFSGTKARGNNIKEIDGAKYVCVPWSARRKSQVWCGNSCGKSLANCVKSWRCVSTSQYTFLLHEIDCQPC